MPDLPPPEWPEDWSSRHAGRYLGAAVSEKRFERPHYYELSFPGCGCELYLVLEYGSARARTEVIIVDQSVLCI